ncbi:hypothetical protein CK203_108041 [Vitis vinifera]|uniref:C-JID domain-containing protein n=1 Tax=Vitis vinifera TaxID=29760 RepID=A0A438D356_VITVI|nr:hypothetical protein CK203_108041 [Vitis vinifera]
MENEQSDTLEAILLAILRFASVTKFMDPMDYSSLRTFASRIPYDAVVPGSSIPEWFTDQSVGVHKGKFGRSAYFSMNESVGFSIDNTASMHFSKAEHIWFGYRSLFGVVFSRSIDHLEVSFSESIRAGEVVKKCGVRLIFQQDLPFGREEMNHIYQHEESEGSYYRWRLRYPRRSWSVDLKPARVVAKHGGLATAQIPPRAKNWMEGKKLKKWPDDMGSPQWLAKLEANESGIQEVPTSITLLTKFQVSALAGCKAGESMSRNLVLSCAHHQQKDFHCLLYLSRNGFITVPGSLKRLIVEQHCKSLKSLPEPPSKRHCGSYSTGNSACCINTEIQSSNTIPEWFIHQGVGCSVTVELPPHWYNTKLMGLAV